MNQKYLHNAHISLCHLSRKVRSHSPLLGRDADKVGVSFAMYKFQRVQVNARDSLGYTKDASPAGGNIPLFDVEVAGRLCVCQPPHLSSHRTVHTVGSYDDVPFKGAAGRRRYSHTAGHVLDTTDGLFGEDLRLVFDIIVQTLYQLLPIEENKCIAVSTRYLSHC